MLNGEVKKYMYLIVGLGNPGKEYLKTRHNVGFLAVDAIQQSLNCGPLQYKKDFKGSLIKTTLHDQPIILLKPETYMNLSGESVQAVAQYFQIPNNHIIIIHDDIDLPIGKVRIVENSSSGGQKGVQSIITHVGKDVIRIKIGVETEDRRQQDTASYVLSTFSKQEWTDISSILSDIPQMTETIVRKGLAESQNLYN